MVTYNVNALSEPTSSSCWQQLMKKTLTFWPHRGHVEKVGAWTPPASGPFKKGTWLGFWIYEVADHDGPDGLLLPFSAKRWKNKQTLSRQQSLRRDEHSPSECDGKSMTSLCTISMPRLKKRPPLKRKASGNLFFALNGESSTGPPTSSWGLLMVISVRDTTTQELENKDRSLTMSMDTCLPTLSRHAIWLSSTQCPQKKGPQPLHAKVSELTTPTQAAELH
jgi:hypothetical protein